MKALVIKNLPDALHLRLKARAVRNHRSLTKEAIALLESGMTTDAPPAVMHKEADVLDSIFAAGDELSRSGIKAKAWAAKSREVWR